MLLVGCGGSATPPAAPVAPGKLTLTLAELDRAYFDAYNGCDLQKLASYLAEDLEFYHDVSGFRSGRQATVDAIQKNVCNQVRRELVTMKVDRLGDYGALEIGTHRFCEPKGVKCDGVGEFVHIWKRDGERWLLTRIISFNHRDIP